MRIEELTLYTAKIEEQKLFYKKLFGVRFTEESKDHFSFQAGWSKVTFSSSKKACLYHYCYLIPSNKLSAAISWLEGKVDLIKTDGQVIHKHIHWNAEAVYFYDAAGNIGEIIARHGMQNERADHFSYEDILCMNEIGLPSSDCAMLNHQISESIGSKIWRGDLKRFVVNGNEEGMFLLVNNTVKKTWYPTNIYPETVSLKARISINKNRFDVIFEDGDFRVVL